MAAERYALLADESGNAKEELRVLAGLSGSQRHLAALERSLRGALRRHGVAEIKWSALRTRPKRLAAAREFLDLALEALASKRLAVDLLVFERSKASRSWEPLGPSDAWMALYRILASKAKRRRPQARWSILPDQRTGMPWADLGAVREASSRHLALIQLADLLAGLTRFSRLEAAPRSLRAHKNRQLLWEEFSIRAKALPTPGRGRLKFWSIRHLRNENGK